MKNKSRITKFFLLSCFLFMVGCGDKSQLQKLHDDIDKIKINATKQVKKTALVELQPPEPASYQVANLRSPFESSMNNKQVGFTHPLQAFSLNVLRFKGTVIQPDHTWAFVLTPDNKLYKVKVGDWIGDHYGKIINIFSDRIEIDEQVLDDKNFPNGAQSTHRIVTLQLKDES
jgi:type IV pilus assembly protein PilP